MKKLALVLLMVLALTIPALANPFVDVPLTHWAYDAVQVLAAKGVVIGYPDGTFGGQRTLTRYEFAEATARLLAYVEQYGGLAEDVEILSKLAVEFADELANLGVTVADLEATVGEHSEAIAAMKAVLDKHERFFEPVKITGKWTADYEKEVFSLKNDPLAPASLTDRVDLKFAAEINPETTADITLRIDNVLKGPVTTITPRAYNLKYAGDWSLWVSSDIEPDTIGLGLVYDFDENEEFAGVWAQWNWNTDEDLGTWTAFTNVDDFYYLNVAFNLGDDDDIPVGITAGYDDGAGLVFGGANVAFNLGDEDKVNLALEGAVASDTAFADIAYGAAAKVNAVFGDDDCVDLTVKGWYTSPNFDLANSAYDANRIGVSAALGFMLTDDDDDLQIKITPKYDYVMEADTSTVTKNTVGLRVDLTNINEDNPDEKAYIRGEYRMAEAGEIYIEGEYLNLTFGDDDEFAFNAHADYLVNAARYRVVANVAYTFPDDPMKLVVEGRVNSAFDPIYSAEAQLRYDIAENTVLKVGVEMNDWEADIADWSDKDDFIINNDKTKVYAGIEVKF